MARILREERIPAGYGGTANLDFGFSEEQEMLRDAAKRFLTDNCPTTYVRKMMAHDTAHDAGFYKKLVELGWPGLLVPEQYGGTGGTFLDLTVIMEEAGKALLPGPFFATALLGAPLIEGGSEAQKQELLPKMADGECWRRSQSPRLRGVSMPVASASRREERRRYMLTGREILRPRCPGCQLHRSSGPHPAGSSPKKASACSWSRATPKALR